MVGIGILIGIAEIILGIIVLFNANGSALIIGTGIGYILSGLLFIWLCAGAAQAFESAKDISKLKRAVKKLQEQNYAYLKSFEKAGLDIADVKLASETAFEDMEMGHKLVSLVEKTLVSNGTVIPKGTELVFRRIEDEENVIVDLELDGQLKHIRYKKNRANKSIFIF